VGAAGIPAPALPAAPAAVARLVADLRELSTLAHERPAGEVGGADAVADIPAGPPDARGAVEAERLGHTDHKSALQELLQSRGMAPGLYHVIAESGPDHQKTFRVEVRICGQVTAMGSGRTKKEAEQSAAVAALIQLGAEENRGTK